MAERMSSISTHVLDTSRGKPAVGVPVRLERKNSTEWLLLGRGETDGDGRCSNLLQTAALVVGTYRLIIDTSSYFQLQSIPYLYPEITITFIVGDTEAHYHIPLLLGPNTYTTYRGS